MNIRKSLSLMIGFCLMVSPKALAMNLNTTYSQDNKDINLLLGDATEIPKHVLKWACNAVLPNESIESIKLSNDKIIKVLKCIEQNFDKIPCSGITKNIKECINVNSEETLDVIFKKILLIWDQRDSLNLIKKTKLNCLVYGVIIYSVLKILDKPCSLELKIGQALERIPFSGELKKVEMYRFSPAYFLKKSDGSKYNRPHYLGQGTCTYFCKEKLLLLPEYLNEVSWNDIKTIALVLTNKVIPNGSINELTPKDYYCISIDRANENLLEILFGNVSSLNYSLDYSRNAYRLVQRVSNELFPYIKEHIGVNAEVICDDLCNVPNPFNVINSISRDIYNSK